MKTKILLSLLVLVFFAGCKKDKYTTKPQLKLKSVNTNVLTRNQTLNFVMEVTDAEGDIQDSIWIEKIVPRCTASNLTLKYKMPDGYVPSRNLKADVTFCLALSSNMGCPVIPGPMCPRNDTATFRFWIKDLKGNVSDTVTSQPIVIVR